MHSKHRQRGRVPQHDYNFFANIKNLAVILPRAFVSFRSIHPAFEPCKAKQAAVDVPFQPVQLHLVFSLVWLLNISL
jgi:hypothetical protein